MSKNIHFIDASAIVMKAVAVKVRESRALAYVFPLDDGGFEIETRANCELKRIAQFSNLKSEVKREDFDGGFTLTFIDDGGEKYTLIPLAYAK